jgi:hypothetical protein
MQLLNLNIPPTLYGGPCTNITVSSTPSVEQINGSGNLVFANYSSYQMFIALGNNPGVAINLATALLIDEGSAGAVGRTERRPDG